jgi:hypothetical protein
MRVVLKTMERVILEVTSKEIENDGFEAIWDKVRTVYPTCEYDVDSIKFDKDNEDIIFIELLYKKLRE